MVCLSQAGGRRRRRIRRRGRRKITYRRADLQVESPHGVTVVHGVERRHLVDTHGRHLQYPGYLVHDTDASEAVLPLPEIEQGHHGGLLILRGIPF